MTKSEKLKHCIGCHDNVYNLGLNGVKECWRLSDMKLVLKKRVHVNDIPPWNNEPEQVPDCRKEKGYIFVAPNVQR